MEETIDPGTGLPVGAQPNPVGAYDFSKAFESVQGMLDKIAQGQANRAARLEKDKKEFDEMVLTKPTVWSVDDAYVQQALDDYDKIVQDAGLKYGLDPDKWPDGTKGTENIKKKIREAEAELNRRAAEAKANQKFYEDNQKLVQQGDGKTYDPGWFTTWGDAFMNAPTTQDRNNIRLSNDPDQSPLQRPYTLDDVVQKYKVFHTVERNGKRITEPHVEDIETRIYQGIQSGVGERMYELNKETPQETKEQFAKRVAAMAPDMLMDSETKLRQGRQQGNDYGFNEMGIRPEFYKKDSGVARTYSDQNVPINSVHYVKKGATTPTVNIGEADLQQQVSMAFITKGANNKYYLFGTRTGALKPLSDPIELAEQDIDTINATLGVDVKADIQREIDRLKWAGNKVQ